MLSVASGLSFVMLMALVSPSQISFSLDHTRPSCLRANSLRLMVDTRKSQHFIDHFSGTFSGGPSSEYWYAKPSFVDQISLSSPLLPFSTQLRRPHTCGIS